MKNYLFFLLFSTAACSSPVSDTSGGNKPRSGDLISTNYEDNFPSFLDAFARALKNRDSLALDCLLDKKLLLWGREDQDPRLELEGRERIAKVLEVYENGGTFDSGTNESVSYKELFSSKEMLKRNTQESASVNEFRTEDFVFGKDKMHQWKLILIFWNTKKQNR